MTSLKRTALTGWHETHGAKLGAFGGWQMPLEYQGTVAEHNAVRDSAGMFDVSHLGTVFVTGDEALDIVAATFTNDPARLAAGASQYTLCCDEHGGIEDDLLCYRLSGERFLLVPNAANTAAVVAALRAVATGRDAAVDDRSRDYATLAVQGRDALPRVRGALGLDGEQVPYLGVGAVEFDGAAGWLCRTGYTGEPGCELVLPNAVALTAWEALAGAGVVPAGLGARDTLRLEMGYPLHGNDLGLDTSPFEARLGWAVKLDREPFRGRDELVVQKERGPRRRLWGLRSGGRRPLRADLDVRRNGAVVGATTSGSYSPTLGVGIGLAYLADSAEPGTDVAVDVRGSAVTCEVVRPPFVDRSPKA